LPSERQTEESDLSIIAQAIRRRIWVVALCFAVAVIGAIILTARADKEYAATSALLLQPSSAFEPQRVVETNLQLTELPDLAVKTARQIPGMSPEAVSEAIATSQEGESNIIEIEATMPDPDDAAAVANAFAEQFLELRQGNAGGEFATEVQFVKRAQPDDNPVSPKPLRNIAFGALIGLVLGVGLALLLEQLDRRVKRQDDLSEVTGLPLLATVPRRKAYDAEHLGGGSLSPAEAEIFLMLRANLRYFNRRKDIRSVVVTSAKPSEGKTLVSLGLTLGAALSGERALLIEADMRAPSLYRPLRLDPSGGLSTLLSDPQAELADLVVSVPAQRLADVGGETTFDVLPAGPVPPNPTQLVESARMRAVLGRATEDYDFVVVDTPPLLVVADAIPLVSSVSGVLAVSGLGVSTRGSANELADHLERMEADVLGLVANFTGSGDRSLEGYGYGRPPETTLLRTPQ